MYNDGFEVVGGVGRGSGGRQKWLQIQRSFEGDFLVELSKGA
jgi:hypothetical protein